MKSVSSDRSTAAWKPLALVSALATLTYPVHAQTAVEQQLPQITVSASRFADDASFAPISATVITADQIREAGVASVNDAIRKIAGVYGRQNLNGTSDYQLDLQGFGATSDNNMVVMVDGIRISENEQATALMSSIPIETVERIEIVRGGSSVLYGDGATGGTIQIITKRGAADGTHGSVVVEAGNRNTAELRASLSQGWNGFSIDANVDDLHTDNYRDNNALHQQNFSGGMQWASSEGRVGLRVDVADQASRLAGGLSLAQFLQNPQQTNTPNNAAFTDTSRYTLFAERNLGAWQLAADVSYRDKTLNSIYSGSLSASGGQMTQFSPRARYLTQNGDVRNELVAGMDFGTSNRSDSSMGYGSQQSEAIYVHDEIRFGDARIAAGVRRESFTKDSGGWVGVYDQSFSLGAWDLQGSYNLTPLLNVFGKVGQSYRVPNIDDDSFTANGAPLNPQQSHDVELGLALGNDANKMTAKVFRHDLTNEIYLDPSVLNPYSFTGFGANVNLDPTRHQGIELEARTSLSQDVSLSAVLQHVVATFTAGPNAGNELTLIPKNTATLRLNWLPGNGQSANLDVQFVDSQRYGNDFSNTCNARIPAYATLDGRYAIQVGEWEFAVSGANLTNRNYFSQAYISCNTDTAEGVYSDPGRVVKLSARKSF